MANTRYAYDHDWLSALIAAEIQRQPAAPIGTVVAHFVTAEVERAAERGVAEAQPVIRAALESWLIQKVEGQLRAERLSIPVSWNGADLSVAVPARLGHRVEVKRSDGTRERAIQYPLWTYQPWEVVERLRASKVAVRDGADRQIAALDRALLLREKYPELTPYEAAEREGLNPATFQPVAQ